MKICSEKKKPSDGYILQCHVLGYRVIQLLIYSERVRFVTLYLLSCDERQQAIQYNAELMVKGVMKVPVINKVIDGVLTLFWYVSFIIVFV